MSYKLTLALPGEGSALGVLGALTKFSSKLRLIFFSALGVQVISTLYTLCLVKRDQRVYFVINSTKRGKS